MKDLYQWDNLFKYFYINSGGILKPYQSDHETFDINMANLSFYERPQFAVYQSKHTHYIIIFANVNLLAEDSVDIELDNNGYQVNISYIEEPQVPEDFMNIKLDRFHTLTTKKQFILLYTTPFKINLENSSADIDENIGIIIKLNI